MPPTQHFQLRLYKLAQALPCTNVKAHSYLMIIWLPRVPFNSHQPKFFSFPKRQFGESKVNCFSLFSACLAEPVLVNYFQCYNTSKGFPNVTKSFCKHESSSSHKEAVEKLLHCQQCARIPLLYIQHVLCMLSSDFISDHLASALAACHLKYCMPDMPLKLCMVLNYALCHSCHCIYHVWYIHLNVLYH